MMKPRAWLVVIGSLLCNTLAYGKGLVCWDILVTGINPITVSIMIMYNYFVLRGVDNKRVDGNKR